VLQLLLRQVETLGDAHWLGEQTCLHLFHHTAAMNLDGFSAVRR
jgi:hypothetical protein